MHLLLLCGRHPKIQGQAIVQIFSLVKKEEIFYYDGGETPEQIAERGCRSQMCRNIQVGLDRALSNLI